MSLYLLRLIAAGARALAPELHEVCDEVALRNAFPRDARGLVSGLAFALDMPLALLLVGVIYIAETLSVILQVTYFKLTHGKRIFKMTPIHHHFEMLGWSEEKIVLVFTAVTVAACVIAWLGVRGRT